MADSNGIVDLLTMVQHAHPRATVQEAMNRTRELGCCPVAIERAIEWLGIDASRTIGRLRRCELLQLGRSIERFWRESAPPHRAGVSN